MTTDYDHIGEQYRQAKQAPWRAHIERHTLMGLIGDVAGKSVLDLACGEGYYTRALADAGAGRVVGVDLSTKMIELASQHPSTKSAVIEYRQGDVREIELGEKFDLVFAAFLLNYARSRDDLALMCQSIARCLHSPGRFVTVNNHPEQPNKSFESTRKYGFVKKVEQPLVEGAVITHVVFLDEGQFEIENYYLPLAAHVESLAQAGLRNVRFHPPEVSPEAIAEFGADYWKAFLDAGPVFFLDAEY